MPWFLPSRSSAAHRTVEVGDGVKTVLDLDQLMPKTIAIQLMGRRHVIKPVTTGRFAEVYQKLSEVDAAVKTKGLSPERAPARYADVMGMICPTITRELVSQMTKEQVEALLALMMRVLSGDAFKDLGDEKKK